jgi:hypothetical protein
MASEFSVSNDGQRYTIRLLSLDEYEAEGGVYFDGGNAGGFSSIDDNEINGSIWDHDAGTVNGELLRKNRARARQDFLAAMVVPGELNADELLDRSNYYYDSAFGAHLIREWPAEAPLHVRMLGQEPFDPAPVGIEYGVGPARAFAHTSCAYDVAEDERDFDIVAFNIIADDESEWTRERCLICELPIARQVAHV